MECRLPGRGHRGWLRRDQRPYDSRWPRDSGQRITGASSIIPGAPADRTDPMASVRRYTETEMRVIFERASQAQPEGERPAHVSAGDLTLEELQTIGHEVGIPAELVADAAKLLDQPPPAQIARRLVGLPIGVGRIVELHRRLTEEEWERLVGELRVTFDARGIVRHEGSLRQWTNGNLQVFLEPSGSGHRLRLRTVSANGRGLIQMGSVLLVGSGVLALAYGLAGVLGDRAAPLVLMAVGGMAAIVLAAVRLPRWARERARQMDLIAAAAKDLSE